VLFYCSKFDTNKSSRTLIWQSASFIYAAAALSPVYTPAYSTGMKRFVCLFSKLSRNFKEFQSNKQFPEFSSAFKEFCFQSSQEISKSFEQSTVSRVLLLKIARNLKEFRAVYGFESSVVKDRKKFQRVSRNKQFPDFCFRRSQEISKISSNKQFLASYVFKAGKKFQRISSNKRFREFCCQRSQEVPKSFEQ